MSISPFSAAMSGLQFGSQLGAARNQTKMMELQNQFARENALAALQLDHDILIRRSGEEARAYTQASMDRQRRAMEVEAQANVAAGEAGVAGISVERIQRNIRRQESTIATRQKQSFDSRMDAIDDQFSKAAAGMVARMQSLTPPSQPNLLAIASKSFGSFLEGGELAQSFDDWWGGLFPKGEST